jgi:hypothetical protein
MHGQGSTCGQGSTHGLQHAAWGDASCIGVLLAGSVSSGGGDVDLVAVAGAVQGQGAEVLLLLASHCRSGVCKQQAMRVGTAEVGGCGVQKLVLAVLLACWLRTQVAMVKAMAAVVAETKMQCTGVVSSQMQDLWDPCLANEPICVWEGMLCLVCVKLGRTVTLLLTCLIDTLTALQQGRRVGEAHMMGRYCDCCLQQAPNLTQRLLLLHLPH